MFRAILATKLTKIANMRQNIFLRPNFNLDIKKIQNLMLKNLQKGSSNKHYCWKLLHIVSQKLYFSLRFSLITVFRKTFLNIFSIGFEMGIELCFFCSYILGQNQTKRLKTKRKTSVLNVS